MKWPNHGFIKGAIIGGISFGSGLIAVSGFNPGAINSIPLIGVVSSALIGGVINQYVLHS